MNPRYIPATVPTVLKINAVMILTLAPIHQPMLLPMVAPTIHKSLCMDFLSEIHLKHIIQLLRPGTLSQGWYNKHMRAASAISLCILIMAVPLVSSCTPAPGNDTIRDALTAHFESRGYRVLELVVGEVAPVELSQRTYMGTPGFIVNIKRITLLKPVKKPGGNAEAVRHTFTGAKLRLRQDPADRGRWQVYIISGIDLI